MCTDPVLLCLDEPAAGLNARESAALSELLLSIRAEHGTSILLIEHDMSVVMEISDHIVVLDHGVKIADGTPARDPRRPKVIAAYLGVEDEEVEPSSRSRAVSRFTSRHGRAARHHDRKQAARAVDGRVSPAMTHGGRVMHDHSPPRIKACARPMARSRR